MRFFFFKKMSCGLTSLNDLLLLSRLSTTLKKDQKSICSSSELLLQSRRGICFKVSPMKAMWRDEDGRVPPPLMSKTVPHTSSLMRNLKPVVPMFDNSWNIEEGEGEYKMRFDDMPPGVTRKDVKVFVEDERLVVKAYKARDEGEREEGGEEEEWSVKNYGRGCNRRIELPVKANVDEIKAQLKDGLLYLTIPKRSWPPAFDLGLE